MEKQELEKNSILKSIYKNMGISDYYREDGGIGFGLLKESNSYNVVLLDEVYKKLLQARKETDNSGIEHFFALMGYFYKSGNDDYFVCTRGILDDNSTNVNDGRCKVSESFIERLNITVNEEKPNFIIMCHTHPKYSQTSFDRNVYDEQLVVQSKLKLRELGMNISDGDIMGFINYKLTQDKCLNRFYFISGISLPNGEFNIFDLNNLKDNPILVSIPNVFRIQEDELVPIPNIWNLEEAKKTY